MVGHKNATFIGLVAILLWSSIVGLIRSVSEIFGATGGAALIYSVASVFLLMSFGLPNVRKYPKGYLYSGSVLFISYELCLALSIGYAQTNQQAIEVSMVNYLWPALTIVGAIFLNKQKANFWLLSFGMMLAFWGIGLVLSGNNGLDIATIIANTQDNTLSYGLALSGAFIWAIYCNITNKMANGTNGVTLFFILTACSLWAKYLFTDSQPMDFEPYSVLLLLLASAAMAFGYAAWNIGILHGNITLLSGASYFIPVLSAMLAAVVLHTPLSAYFWKGAFIVCLGSILCWLATRKRQEETATEVAEG